MIYNYNEFLNKNTNIHQIGEAINNSNLQDFQFKLDRIAKNISVEPLINIFGEIHKSQPDTSNSSIRSGSRGRYHDDPSLAHQNWYICYDNNGDFVSFINKPSKQQFTKASEYVENNLKKLLGNDKEWNKFNPRVKCALEEYNPYYQPKNTYGIRIKIVYNLK